MNSTGGHHEGDALAALAGTAHGLLALVRETPPEHFQDEAMAVIRQAVRFDVALCASAQVGSTVLAPHSYHVSGAPPDWSAQAFEAYGAVMEEDWLARMAIAGPGTCFGYDGRTPPPDASAEWVAFNERFGIRQAVCTMLGRPISKLGLFISLYRSDAGDPFSQGERRVLELVTPILATAWDVNRLHALESFRTPRDPDAGTGMADDRGVLHVVEAQFERVLRQEWPTWTGPQLPPQLAALAVRGGGWKGLQLVARAAPPAGGFTTIRVQPRTRVDRLSPRELEIARLWASGQDAAEVAAALGLRVASVRSRLQRIYLKLGVHDRAGMVRVLTPASPQG